jgi:hypothetical protein
VTPYQANKALAVVGSMYGFAPRRGLVPKAFIPAGGIEQYCRRSAARVPRQAHRAKEK